ARLAHVLLQLLELAVGEGVHRVDHDRPGAPGWIRALGGEDGAHDRDEEAKRLSGAGPRRDDEAFAVFGDGDRLFLVLVERQRSTIRAEDVGGAGVEGATGDEGGEALPRLVARVDLDEWIWPEAPGRVDGLDLRPDVVGEDGGERCREASVLADDRV